MATLNRQLLVELDGFAQQLAELTEGVTMNIDHSNPLAMADTAQAEVRRFPPEMQVKLGNLIDRIVRVAVRLTESDAELFVAGVTFQLFLQKAETERARQRAAVFESLPLPGELPS